MRAQFGHYGRSAAALSANFAHQRALDLDVPGRLGLAKPMLPIGSFTKLSKRDMLHNDVCPEIRVDPQTFEVFVDGVLATCEPAREVCLGQHYLMR
jgi:urease subunit alpha